MRTYLMQKDFAASTDAGAQLTILQNGTIRHVQIITNGDLDADGEFYGVELSTVPMYQADKDGSVGTITLVAEQLAAAAAGSIVVGKNVQVPCNIPVKTGDKLYLNAKLTGTNDITAVAIVNVV